MEASTFFTFYIVGFMILWGGLVIGGMFWLRWKRKTRWPFKDSDKLLRSPGETLKRRVSKIDEDFVIELFAMIVAALLILPLAAKTAKALGLTGWLSLLAVFSRPMVILLFSTWRFLRRWSERSRCYLGWYAERMTAENLRPLHYDGYRTFHDVPAEPGAKAFNLDHVVVGPTGVAAVETKCRRKGKARQGLKDHEVIFDGKKMIWPSGEDRSAIEQTVNEAEWLRKWIFERLGLRVPVRAVVAVPGWFVRESPSAILRVVNPKILRDVNVQTRRAHPLIGRATKRHERRENGRNINDAARPGRSAKSFRT